MKYDWFHDWLSPSSYCFSHWLQMVNCCSRFHCSETIGYQNQRFYAYFKETWVDSFEVHPDSYESGAWEYKFWCLATSACMVIEADHSGMWACFNSGRARYISSWKLDGPIATLMYTLAMAIR